MLKLDPSSRDHSQLHLTCPHCGLSGDCGEHCEHPVPCDGYAFMCRDCGQWSVFDAARQGLEKPTGLQLAMIADSAFCARLKAISDQTRRKSLH